VFGGVLASIVLLAVLFAILKWRVDHFDRTTMISLSIGVLLLWAIPWGIFVIIPLALVISFSSPAGRDEWGKFRNRRIAVSLVLLIVLNSFALYPVSDPVGAEEWGDPIATENPHASSWPASEQYTWLHEGAVISVIHLRTPHTFSPWSQDSSTLTLGVMLGMHDERMRQSIEVMNSFIPGFSIDPDSFWLEEVEGEGEHQYGSESQYVTRFNVKRVDFDTKLATVLIVGFTNAGGELSLLSITRPLTSSQGDVFEEKLVLQYIDY
tara:strand:+ start:886 stop:1683 length:798 start_codon:yes stop_codon:yes gene_type:complete